MFGDPSNHRRLAVEHEVAAAQKRRKVVEQVVRGRVNAKQLVEVTRVNASPRPDPGAP